MFYLKFNNLFTKSQKNEKNFFIKKEKITLLDFDVVSDINIAQ